METIIGYELEKERIQGLADVLKNHEKYKDKGVYIPKGLLLTGPAGVGKTMFAKYLSQLSGSNLFIFTPSSEDDTNLDNAQKFKKLFEKAKANTPSVIFVDEFDSYMPDDYFDSDERSDFLATVLKTLDGEGYEGIMFVAACINRSEIPEQVLRSGRIDEHICLYKPDIQTRKLIIQHYLSTINLTFEVDPLILAYKTPNFVGAELKNLINMVARLAISSGKTIVTLEDFLESIYTIQNKDIKRKNNDKNDRYLCGVHEIGHLIVGKILMNRSYDVTVDSYDCVKGITSLVGQSNENSDSSSKTIDKDYCLKLIAVSLGGMAAEILFFKTSTGSKDDISKCFYLINEAFKNGYFGFQYLDPSRYNERSDWSEKHKNKYDKKALSILKNAFKKAKKVILQNTDLFQELLDRLVDKDILLSEESDAIFTKYGY